MCFMIELNNNVKFVDFENFWAGVDEKFLQDFALNFIHSSYTAFKVKFGILLDTNMEKANKNLNRIKVILAEKNLQNKWLAEKIGRDQATVSKWATNSTQPSLDMLIKIAKVLEVDLTDLVRIPQDD